MTLIAFATYGNRAELVTDTIAYTPWCRTFAHRTKFMPMPHLDAVLATQGDHVFGVASTFEFGELGTSFDDTLNRASGMFRSVWQTAPRGYNTDGTEASAFLIGNSAEAGEFVAYRYLAEHDFEPEQVTGTHIMPTPMAYRPADFELARLLDHIGAEADQVRDQWATHPEPPIPASREEWVRLAMLAREQRALHPDPNFKVLLAGKLMWTRIAPGRIRTEVIHEFNDTGDELDALVANTLHPRAQIAPCRCGSGERALDCHIASHADQDCPCERYDKTFRDCCMLTPEEAVAAETMGLV